MPTEQRPCDFCMAYGAGGHFMIGRDARGAELSWTAVETTESYYLCGDCFQDATGFIATAMGPNEQRPAGWPTTISPETISSDQCNACGGQLANESYPVDTFPAQTVAARRGASHRTGQPRQVRVCAGCLAWIRSRLYEDSGVRGGSARGQVERRATSIPGSCPTVSSVFLGREDEKLLRLTAEQSGCDYRRMRPSEARDRDGWSDGVVFVGSGSSGLATMLADSLPARARQRMVVVSRFDSVSDMSGALLKGASHFVASPLTTQQIIGACKQMEERQRAAAWPQHSSGLSILRPSDWHAHVNRQVVQVQLQRSADRLETAWLLRRFLRGGDRVGLDEHGNLQALVDCPDEAANEVIRRMAYILGSRAAITLKRPDSATERASA